MSESAATAPTYSRRDTHGMTVGRTASFADGLFGIAMTILVLSISEPTGNTGAELWRSIRAMGPEVFGYALSFAVIGRYWIAHHVFMRRVRHATVGFLALTLVFMSVVAFVSIPTQVIGDSSGDGSAFTVAVIFYAVSLALLGTTFVLLELYALAKDLIYPEDRADQWAGMLPTAVAPIVFWCSVPVALLFGGQPASWSWFAIIPLSIVAGVVQQRRSRKERAT
ncbi:MAG: TMEM175 family protein [Acidimicrobiia bacterium]